MSSPEFDLGLQLEEKDLGPFGFLDIGYGEVKKTFLLANADRDYSVGCVLLDDDKSIVACYENPKLDEDPLQGLSVVGGFTWEEGLLMVGHLLQGWINKAQMKHSPFLTSSLATKFNPHVTEPNAFIHLNGQRLSGIDNQTSQMKMSRLRRSGFYVPTETIIELAE